MGAREHSISVSLSQRDALERHNRALLRALQLGQQVVYEGRPCRINWLHFLSAGGGTEVDVYLDGFAGAVNPLGVVVVESAAPAGPLDEEHEHNRVLLHALQIARRVVRGGRFRFIHALSFRADGTSTKAVVYLAGSAEPIAPAEVTLAPSFT